MILRSASSIRSVYLIFLLAVPRPSWAAPTDACMLDAVCRSYEDRGLELSARSAYRGALAAFQAAYARTPAPRLLINMGRSLYRMGRLQEAIDYYERFSRANVSPDPEVAQKVQRYIQEARAALATQAAVSEKPGGSKDEDPVSAPESPAAPQSPAAPESPAASESPAAAARAAAPPAVAAPLAISLPTAANQHRSSRAASIVLLSVGAASLAVGIGLGVRAASLANEVLDGTGTFNDDLFAQGVTFNQAAITLDVLGGTAVLAGAVWLGIWRARHAQKIERSTVGSRQSGRDG